MSKLISPILVLAAVAAILAGCGGGGGGSKGASSGGGSNTGGGGLSGIKVGDCLNNDENFLVQPSDTKLDGQSPAGVSFTLTLYPTPAAAQAAAAKKSKKTTSIVENGVIDFKGNPTIYAGAPPAKISPSELNAIKRCIDKTRGQ